MTKRILFCADGTWNGPETETGVAPLESNDDHGELKGAKVTNVVKLFANLAGRVTPETMTLLNEQEKALVDGAGETAQRTLQIAKYIHGVGDSGNVLKKAFGGMFGMGVIARVVRGYTFISRYYDPGDEIHIVGFSRGAYTARALGGLIASVGLLDRTTYDAADKEQAYRLGMSAWCKCKSMSLHGAGKITDLANHVLNFVTGFFARSLDDKQLIKDVPIESIGVWDTVGSMGIPAYVADQRYDVFRFVDTRLSDKVRHGFHAMAVDELRADFPVTAWEPRDGVKQVWFVGAHADVGGGYPAAESALSDVALDWMMKQLAEVGVRLATPLTYTPKPAFASAIHQPWTEAPFAILPRAPRQVTNRDIIHDSVLRRWQSDSGYRPKALAAVGAAGLDKLLRDV